MTNNNFQPKHVYVEIGPGLSPASLKGSRHFDDSCIYVGVDKAIGKYGHVEGREYGQQVKDKLSDLATKLTISKPTENITFVEGDGAHLPFASDTVEEVYMANMLTAPMRSSERHELLAEASRVLRGNGKLIVKVSWDAWMWPKDEVEEWISATGFGLEAVVTREMHEFTALEDVFGQSEEQGRHDYYVVASKPR